MRCNDELFEVLKPNTSARSLSPSVVKLDTGPSTLKLCLDASSSSHSRPAAWQPISVARSANTTRTKSPTTWAISSGKGRQPSRYVRCIIKKMHQNAKASNTRTSRTQPDSTASFRRCIVSVHHPRACCVQGSQLTQY